MDQATLVSPEFGIGSEVLAQLDQAGIAPKVCLWMTTPEYEDGRLVLASPMLDQFRSLKAYDTVAEKLHGMSPYRLPAIMILRMNDRFIKALRDSFSKAASVEGMRLGHQTIGDRYVSDAYVYRIK